MTYGFPYFWRGEEKDLQRYVEGDDDDDDDVDWERMKPISNNFTRESARWDRPPS